MCFSGVNNDLPWFNVKKGPQANLKQILNKQFQKCSLPKTKTVPKKAFQWPSQKEISSSNHQFSE